MNDCFLRLLEQDEFLSQRVDLIAEDQCGNIFIDPRYVLITLYSTLSRTAFVVSAWSMLCQ
jgi:hypothetical protein